MHLFYTLNRCPCQWRSRQKRRFLGKYHAWRVNELLARIGLTSQCKILVSGARKCREQAVLLCLFSFSAKLFHIIQKEIDIHVSYGLSRQAAALSATAQFVSRARRRAQISIILPMVPFITDLRQIDACVTGTIKWRKRHDMLP